MASSGFASIIEPESVWRLSRKGVACANAALVFARANRSNYGPVFSVGVAEMVGWTADWVLGSVRRLSSCGHFVENMGCVSPGSRASSSAGTKCSSGTRVLVPSRKGGPSTVLDTACTRGIFETLSKSGNAQSITELREHERCDDVFLQGISVVTRCSGLDDHPVLIAC